jgi:hypothetical protein
MGSINMYPSNHGLIWLERRGILGRALYGLGRYLLGNGIYKTKKFTTQVHKNNTIEEQVT